MTDKTRPRTIHQDIPSVEKSNVSSEPDGHNKKNKKPEYGSKSNILPDKSSKPHKTQYKPRYGEVLYKTEMYADFISRQQAKLRGAGLVDEVVQEDIEQLDEVGYQTRKDIEFELGHEDRARADAWSRRNKWIQTGGRPSTKGPRHIFKSHEKADPNNVDHVGMLRRWGVKPTSNGKGWHVAAGSMGSDHMRALTGQNPTEWSPKS